MSHLTPRHPSEIRPGDCIQHAGIPAQVLDVEPSKSGIGWRFTIQYEYGRSGQFWVSYPDDGRFSSVLRYENTAKVSPTDDFGGTLAQVDGDNQAAIDAAFHQLMDGLDL